MKKITFSFPIIIVISLAIQGLGLVKSLILAKDFGASSTLDAFYLANVFTVSVFTVVGSAITTIVIPELNANIRFQQKKMYIEKYLTFIRSFSLVVSLVLFVVIVLGRNIFVPKFSDQIQILFIILTAILLISQQFKIQASFSVSLLQNEGHYIIPRFLDIIPILIPTVYLVLANSVNIKTLTYLTAIAYILETITFNYIQSRLNSDFIFRLRFGVDSDVKRMLTNTLPILLSSTVFQIQVLLSNYFAGFFGQGYITLLSNTNQIMGIFQALFILNLINMIYPKLVKDIKSNFVAGIARVSKYVSLTNLIVIVLIWGYAAVGLDLVKLLFVRGNFTIADARVVYRFGLVLGMVLPFDVMRDYSYRIYYAIGNTRKPMNNSVVTVVINIMLLVILANVVGPISVVLAPAIGTLFSTCSVLIKAHRDMIRVDIKNIIINYLLSNLLGSLMYLVIKTINYISDSLVQELLVNVSIGFGFVLLTFTLILFVAKCLGKNLIQNIFN